MELQVGSILEGKVTTITKFGAFVDLGEGKTGMVHISEVAPTYVKEITDHVAKDQVVKVKVISISPEGKIALSIKKAMEQPQQAAGAKPGFDGQKPSRPRSPRPAPAPRYNSLDFAQKHKDEPKSFEDMMAKFKQTSDDKMSDLKHNIDNKRGGGRRGYSK